MIHNVWSLSLTCYYVAIVYCTYETFVCTLRGIRGKYLRNFTDTHITQWEIIKHARAITEGSCAWNFSIVLATFRASGSSHDVTECILTWIYCRCGKHTMCHTVELRKAERIYAPWLLSDRTLYPIDPFPLRIDWLLPYALVIRFAKKKWNYHVEFNFHILFNTHSSSLVK